MFKIIFPKIKKTERKQKIKQTSLCLNKPKRVVLDSLNIEYHIKITQLGHYPGLSFVIAGHGNDRKKGR